MKLLLFDVDGTLIHTGGAGRRAMMRAFEAVYGLGDGFKDIQMMGRTDPSILREALTNRGLVWQDEETERFREIYYRLLEEEIQIPRPDKRFCPGIPALLEALQGKPGCVLGLLTGNWRSGAFIKLGHFGIDGYFRVGAFGDDSSRREDLVPVALARLKESHRMEMSNSDVYVIGDTPLDICCAKQHGARTVGVATGFHSVDELKSEGPDYLFPNFEDVEEVVEALCHS